MAEKHYKKGTEVLGVEEYLEKRRNLRKKEKKEGQDVSP